MRTEEDYPQGGFHSNYLGPQSSGGEGPYRGQEEYQRPQHAPIHSEYPREQPGHHNQGPYYPHGGSNHQNYPQGAQRTPSHSRPMYHNSDPKRPIVLKVSRLKNVESHPSKLPDGPSVFYAPSPDVKYKKDSRNRHSSPHRHPQRHERPLYHQVHL